MMMDTSMDTDGTAFICPECSFNGTSLPELISHMNDAHSEETASKSEAPPKNPSLISNEKRSRRKPAFSHQIISQAPRSSLPIFKQNNVDPGSIHFWNRVVTADKNDQQFSEPNLIRDENVIHSSMSSQRPIAPKSTNLPMQPVISAPSFHSSSIQPIQKNFQCRICHLTYKNFHDCTAHIRRKHEITHAQAGRYVGKLDTDVPLPPSATGHYKIRLKVKSLPPQPPAPTTTTTARENFTKTYRCKYCSYSTPWLSDMNQHEQQKHRNYSSYRQEDISSKNNNNNNNGFAELMIDNIQSFGEVLPNQNDEIITIEEDLDDDEEDALWKYQQEINNLSGSPTSLNNSLHKTFKKFQCPHCEHSSSTLTKLKLHISTHINIKPFMCSICGWRANLRWYIQCHAKKRHPNENFEVLQLSPEEAEQTINAYMRERNCDTKFHNRHDSKLQYQCSLCQFRSNHPRFIEQHIETNHAKMAKPITHHSDHNNSQSMSNIVYPNFSSHPNFNPNRLYYCSLCYRGYRWRYDVKRHHKTMHETAEDELNKGQNFHYLEYVPHLDGLISATMSSANNQFKHDNENHQQQQQQNHSINNNHIRNHNHITPIVNNDDDDDLKLSIADARTVDVNDDEAAALLMIEPDKSDIDQIVIDDHPEDSIIVFEDDRVDKSVKTTTTTSTSSSSRPSFKPFRCPYCFYRTNWRTDCIRHIRARHKIEPSQSGYYEMSNEKAEETFDEYERTYGFIVAKKVLAKYTDFRQIEWEDLKNSIWEKIKDKTDIEQCIIDRLRPNDYTVVPSCETPIQPMAIPVPTKVSTGKIKRIFTCMDCAFHSHKLHELERHICSRIQKIQPEKSHGKFVVSLYECTKCSYRTVKRNYARQHVYFHRLKTSKKHSFYYCSFCGYNHRYRSKISIHLAKYHPRRTSSNCLTPCHNEFDADFSIRQSMIKRSFVERQLKKAKVFYCNSCPYISTSIVEHDQHRFYHQENSSNVYKCQYCSFASKSLVYTNQHQIIHSNELQTLSFDIDQNNLQLIPISTIYKEFLGKIHRYHCPFCKRFASSSSSQVLNHVKNTHTGTNQQLFDSLIIGSDIAQEILNF